jgi:hypothetical protein
VAAAGRLETCPSESFVVGDSMCDSLATPLANDCLAWRQAVRAGEVMCAKPLTGRSSSLARVKCSLFDPSQRRRISARFVNRLTYIDIHHGPTAKYFEHLALENSAKSRTILVKADQIADMLGVGFRSRLPTHFP